ncbi:MAG: Uma2 family endonuclease [Saprospiraceae bacterium]
MTAEVHSEVPNFVFHGLGPVNDEAFERLCAANPELQIEREPNGNITIMPPVHIETGRFEAEAFGQLYSWNRQTQLGKVFSASAGFTLPDDSIRSADASWVSNEKYEQLSPGELKTFARLVPDFVIEIKSDTDSLKKLREKMTSAWIGNGVLLAWLLDVKAEKAYVYRANGSVDVVEGFDKKLSGENVLPGFEFDLNLLKNN